MGRAERIQKINKLQLLMNRRLTDINKRFGSLYFGSRQLAQAGQSFPAAAIGMGLAEAAGSINPLTTPTERAVSYISAGVSAALTAGGVVAGAAIGGKIGAVGGGWGAAIGAAIGAAAAAIVNAIIASKADDDISVEKKIQSEALTIIQSYREQGISVSEDDIQKLINELNRVYNQQIQARIDINERIDDVDENPEAIDQAEIPPME